MLEPTIAEAFFYNRFYYFNLCHVCKKYEKTLKRCGKCKSISYCCKDHQIFDWKYHKVLCNIIEQSNKALLITNKIKTFHDYKTWRLMQSAAWQNALKRKLNKFEDQMWMFPRICAVCFSSSAVINCHNCLGVCYCSEEHKKQHEEIHKKHCVELKLCMDIDITYFENEFTNNKDLEVKDFNENMNIFPGSLNQLMSLYCKNFDSLTEIIYKIHLSDRIVPAAIIIYALEKASLLRNRLLCDTKLTVHIVGADLTEMGWLWKEVSELLFHWIKNLVELNYFVIGPDICYDGSTSKFASQLCGSCQKRKPKTFLSFHSKLYHEIVKELKKPDAVVCFNSGIHEFNMQPKSDAWKKSISSLTEYPEVPLILTAYTLKEILKDIERVKKSSAKTLTMVLKPRENPFRNMTPIRDWETENAPLFYTNGFLAILK